MEKIYSYLLCALAGGALVFSSCTKESDEPQKPAYNGFDKEVGELLQKGGILKHDEPKYEKTTTITSKESIDDYNDPVNNYIYPAYSTSYSEHYSIVDNPMEFATLDPWASLWPGALIQGGSLANGNVPALIPVGPNLREPGRVYIAMVSGNQDQDSWFREVPVSGAYVTQAMNELLENVYDNPAHTAFDMSTVYSSEDIGLKLGLNLKIFGGKLRSTFGSFWSQEKSYVAVRLSQIFFTVGFEDPSLGKVFKEGAVPATDLSRYTGPGNPICYVSSVSYGRSFIMLYESSVSRDSLALAVKTSYRSGLFGGASAQVDEKIKNVIHESSVKAIQIGGDPVTGLETIIGNFDQLHNFLVNGANVSRSNIGSPISYKINYLYDNTNVLLSNTLEYTITNKVFVPQKPRKDIGLDFYNAEITVEKEGARHISNFCYAKINDIRIIGTDLNDETKKINYSFSKHDAYVTTFGKEYSSRFGTSIPLYGSFYSGGQFLLSEMPKLRIEADVEIFNSSYGGSRKEKTDKTTIVSQFEYDTANNKWVEHGNPDSSNEFRKMVYCTGNVADLKTTVTIHYRFKGDGLVYPLDSKQ